MWVLLQVISFRGDEQMYGIMLLDVLWMSTLLKSLMAKSLKQASQWHEMYCQDLEIMSLNPSWVELGVRSAYV